VPSSSNRTWISEDAGCICIAPGPQSAGYCRLVGYLPLSALRTSALYSRSAWRMGLNGTHLASRLASVSKSPRWSHRKLPMFDQLPGVLSMKSAGLMGVPCNRRQEPG
jgi:hypothetical protein